MSYHTAQKAESGLYECVDCGKPLFLTDNDEVLPSCSYCKATEFISSENEDEFYGCTDDIEDITVNQFMSNYIN